VLLLVLAVLAPAPAPAAVGVVWHDEATVDEATRQRLLAEVRAAGGGATAIIEHADARAAEIVSSEIDRAVIERQIARHDALQHAESLYRDGDMSSAQAAAIEVAAQLRAEPVAPHAARMLARCHLLLAQIRWTEGDPGGSEAELRGALLLDPGARISRRRANPELVERFDRIREQLEADRSRWPTPAIELDDDARIEIDGLDGLRPLPPGSHFVVVRRSGAEVDAAYVDGPWTPPPPRVVVERGVPRDVEHAERICEALELRTLVIARRRGDRFGVQGYRCGDGFSTAWYGAAQALDDGVFQALLRPLAAPADRKVRSERLLADAVWPIARPQPAITAVPDVPASKPWFRRAWVWSLLGGLVVAAVVTGAVVGTRHDRSGIAVDGDSFLDPR
jgi:hypothetical protein